MDEWTRRRVGPPSGRGDGAVVGGRLPGEADAADALGPGRTSTCPHANEANVVESANAAERRDYPEERYAAP